MTQEMQTRQEYADYLGRTYGARAKRVYLHGAGKAPKPTQPKLPKQELKAIKTDPPKEMALAGKKLKGFDAAGTNWFSIKGITALVGLGAHAISHPSSESVEALLAAGYSGQWREFRWSENGKFFRARCIRKSDAEIAIKILGN